MQGKKGTIVQVMGPVVDVAFDHAELPGIQEALEVTNKAVMDAYDATISALSNKGMTVTAIILNDWNPNTPDLIYPGTEKTSFAYYYMF